MKRRGPGLRSEDATMKLPSMIDRYGIIEVQGGPLPAFHSCFCIVLRLCQFMFHFSCGVARLTLET